MVRGELRVPERLILFEKWMETTKWLFERTQRFPRAIRQTLTNRMESAALEFLELLTTAAYQPRRRRESLQEANNVLNRLRVLIRLAHSLKLLSTGQLEEAAERIDESGRLLGGWSKANAE